MMAITVFNLKYCTNLLAFFCYHLWPFCEAALWVLLIGRAHSFSRAMEFQAELQNLLFSVEF